MEWICLSVMTIDGSDRQKHSTCRFVPIEVVISEWPPVAIDTNHLLLQPFCTICVSPRTIEFLTFLWCEIQVLRAVPGRLARQAQPCSSLLRKFSGR
jgi:hypothetical protein